MRLAGKVIATLETSFGFFPEDAFENQAGLTPAAAEAEMFALPAAQSWQLRGSAAQALGSAGAALAGEPLLMLDRVTGWWPDAGAAQLGMLRAEKDVVKIAKKNMCLNIYLKNIVANFVKIPKKKTQDMLL